MAKLSRTPIYTLLGVAVIASYFFLNSGTASAKPKASTTPKKSSKAANEAFTKEDYNAKFQAISDGSRNVFTPLVARTSARGATMTISMMGGVPTELTLGEADWYYTGMAEVDSVPTALLENNVKQEGVFLKQGEHWKQAKVFQITPDELTLVGPDGTHHYIKVRGSEEAAVPVAGFRPLAINPPPGLQGPIGNGEMQVRPERTGNRAQGVANVPNIN